jgi:hypothetical protein
MDDRETKNAQHNGLVISMSLIAQIILEIGN